MSKKLVNIPCGQGKIWNANPDAGPVEAANAYTGAPFKVNREYAERFVQILARESHLFRTMGATAPAKMNHHSVCRATSCAGSLAG